MRRRPEDDRRRFSPPDQRTFTWLWALVAIVVLLVLVTIVLGVAVIGIEPGPSVEKIVATPAAYIGQTVTVDGEVNQVLSPRALLISPVGQADGPQLLVVAAAEDTIGPDTTVGRAARVTGVVEVFNRTRVAAETGTELEANAFNRFEGQPVIVAQSLELGAGE